MARRKEDWMITWITITHIAVALITTELMLTRQLTQAQYASMGSDCKCWNASGEGDEDSWEVECKCRGKDLPSIPDHLKVQRLVLYGSGMETLPEGSLQKYHLSLQDVILSNMRSLKEIETGAFQNLSLLRTIYIHNAPILTHLSMDTLQLHSSHLRVLRIVNTGLRHLPTINHVDSQTIMHLVDLENNHLEKISTRSIILKAEQLLLNFNEIQSVDKEAFHGAQIAKISLKGNRQLTYLHPEAFVGLESLRELDLSETAITSLPTSGLEELEVLRLENTFSLKVFPSVYNFEAMMEARLTYPYHCCAFQFPEAHDPHEHTKHEKLMAQIKAQYCSETTPSPGHPPEGKSSENHTEDHFSHLLGGIWETGKEVVPEGFGTEEDPEEDPDCHAHHNHSSPSSASGSHDCLQCGRRSAPQEGVFHQTTVLLPPTILHAFCGNFSRRMRHVKCWPRPDAFNPCEDLLGHTGLRVAAWLVAAAALAGNMAVLLVLGNCGRRCRLRMRLRLRPAAAAQRFLMAHLAFADLCMGAYLLLLAAQDLRSRGNYFNYAIDWQRGSGCQVAGFLTVFASELSVFTLALLTGERWYTITFALHLTRRMRIRTASRMVLVGWCYALLMAILPLFGISSYSKTSICLPMEQSDLASSAYLSTLLVCHLAAFLLVVGCYGRMYWSIRGRGRSGCLAMASDLSVAKKMALLVFTDFACWVPIAFFGLTALAGHPLIGLSHAKILLVFFYPLNACANPYLYALLTKQFQRDFSIMISRQTDECRQLPPSPTLGKCGGRGSKTPKPSSSSAGAGGLLMATPGPGLFRPEGTNMATAVVLLPRSGSAHTQRSLTTTSLGVEATNNMVAVPSALHAGSELAPTHFRIMSMAPTRRLSVVLETSSRTSDSNPAPLGIHPAGDAEEAVPCS